MSIFLEVNGGGGGVKAAICFLQQSFQPLLDNL